MCATLRNVLAANVDADHDRRVVTPLHLTFDQTAKLLGLGVGNVRSLVSEGELRAVTVQSYGRRRIPRVELDEYVSRLLTGQFRPCVEARRDLDRWGLRYMADRRMYTDKNGRRKEWTVSWHLGDAMSALCGTAAVGRWEITTQAFWISRVCRECEAVRDRIRLEKLEGRCRPPLTPRVVRSMLRVVQQEGGGEAVRRTRWHLGDGRATLCGLKRDRRELPDRRPRARPFGVHRADVGLDGELWPARLPPLRC